MSEALVEFGLQPDVATNLVDGFGASITDAELLEQFPIVRDNFSEVIQEYPQIAEAMLVSVVANGFMLQAGEDADRLQSASRNAFSGDPSSLDDVRAFTHNPTWESFQEKFGDKMTSQPEAMDIFGKRDDLDPQMWKLSTYLTLVSYIHAKAHDPGEDVEIIQ